MKPARMLTRPQLEARMEVLSKRSSEICSELIAAGRGNERPSETRNKTDPLSVRFLECAAQSADAWDEAARRRTYHGSLLPIRGEALE